MIYTELRISEVTPKSIKLTLFHPHDAVEEVTFVYTKLVSDNLAEGIASEIDFAPKS